MKTKLFLSAAPMAMMFAATTMMSAASFAAQPVNIEEIRCSNNGNGNGEEVIVEVGVRECKKNVDINTDLPGEPGVGPVDPN